MAITQSQFKTWLGSDTAIVCTLVELVGTIDGADTKFYFSNRTYNTTSTDTDADGTSRSNISYDPAIVSSVEFSESLPIDGSANISFGDIAIDNVNGVRDSWLDGVWVNRPISIYIGDPRWQRSNFVKIFSGLISDVGFSERNVINFSIRSILEKLNVPITSKKISDLPSSVAPNASTLQNKDQLVPLLFGEVFNISPISIDPATYTYMIHDGPIERIIEVRDNGVPLIENIGYVPNTAKGTFRLLRPPAGVITCSAQGEQNSVSSTGTIQSGIWAYTVSKIIQLIVLKYGKDSMKVLPSELDLDAMNGFDLNNTSAVGIYITSSTNVISVCQDLAASLGAQFTATRGGLITLLRITIPNSAPGSSYINDANVFRESFAVQQKVPVKGVVKLGYVKNWTVQTQLLTGLPEEHKVAFGTEYRYAESRDENVVSKYMLANNITDPKPTLLLTAPNASIEANRLLALWSVPRYVFKFQATREFLTLALGEMINLTYYRFGLTGSKPAQVISIQTNWNSGLVSLEVLV